MFTTFQKTVASVSDKNLIPHAADSMTLPTLHNTSKGNKDRHFPFTASQKPIYDMAVHFTKAPPRVQHPGGFPQFGTHFICLEAARRIPARGRTSAFANWWVWLPQFSDVPSNVPLLSLDCRQTIGTPPRGLEREEQLKLP
jgi:hypothetical protein